MLLQILAYEYTEANASSDLLINDLYLNLAKLTMMVKVIILYDSEARHTKSNQFVRWKGKANIKFFM